MATRSGKLKSLDIAMCDRLATLQVKTVTKDSVGGDVPTWATRTTMWIWLSPMSGQKNTFAGQLRPTLTHRIYTPFFITPTFDAAMRIQLDSINYNIQGIPVDIDNAHEFLEFSVIQGVANT